MMLAMDLDHLVYTSLDLDHAVEHFAQRFGVRAAPGGKHEALGTHNALLGLGPSSYLEILSPDPDRPRPEGEGVLGLATYASSDLLATWALRCDDIDAAVAHARQNGVDPWDPVDMQRTEPDGTVLSWRLTINAIAGGVLPFLISWGDTPHPVERTPRGLVLESFHVEHPDVATTQQQLHALGAEVEVRHAAAPALVARISGPGGTLELR